MTSIAALSVTSALTLPGSSAPGLAGPAAGADPMVPFLDLVAPPVAGTIALPPRPAVAAPGKSLPPASPRGDDPIAWLASVDAPAAALAAAPAATPTGTAAPLLDPAKGEDAIVADLPPTDAKPAKARKAPARADLPLPRFARALKPADAKVETRVAAGTRDEEPATDTAPPLLRIAPPVAPLPAAPPPPVAPVPAPEAGPATAAPVEAPTVTANAPALPTAEKPDAAMPLARPEAVEVASVDTPAPPPAVDGARPPSRAPVQPPSQPLAAAPVAGAPATTPAMEAATATVATAPVASRPTRPASLRPSPLPTTIAPAAAPPPAAPGTVAPSVAAPVALPTTPTMAAPPLAAPALVTSPAVLVPTTFAPAVPPAVIAPTTSAPTVAPTTTAIAPAEAPAVLPAVSPAAPASTAAAPVTPAPPAPSDLPLPAAVAPRFESAARTFADAIHRAAVADAPEPALAAAPLQQVAGLSPTTATPPQAPIDMTQPHWPTKMIERIEALREMVPDVWVDRSETSVRLIPDALGTIDVSLRRDGDTVQVQIKAEQPQTRQLLADAAPKLAELAEQRGLKLHQASADAPFGGNSAGQQAPSRQQAQQQQPAAPIPRRATADAPLPDDDARVA